ncbi:MAG TPA: pantetheine-phosphate adenylyltransferase [Atopostipes sp.]|nr:pantetheine-phosphate adenylyltransferase [Atopostipes sp.]
MTKAIYAGSFDPFTLGHLDIVNRSSKMFDEVIVALGTNTSKKSLFTADEKLEMIQEVIDEYSNDNVKVIQYTDGLIVNLAKKLDAKVMLRGLRSVADMEYEMNIASMNKTQAPEIESVFLMADEKYRFVSSSLIKEIAQFDGDVSGMVPENIAKRMKEKYYTM